MSRTKKLGSGGFLQASCFFSALLLNGVSRFFEVGRSSENFMALVLLGQRTSGVNPRGEGFEASSLDE